MIYERSSMRCRVFFETGMIQFGGNALFLSSEDIHSGQAVSDIAKVLSRYVDRIKIRTYGHECVDNLAENGSISVINGLTDSAHSSQVLSVLLTIYVYKRTIN